MTSRNGTTPGTGPSRAPATQEQGDLAALLVEARASGRLDNELAPALVTLLEQLYNALSAGQVADATARLHETLGPALALGQARQVLVSALVMVDSTLINYQRRRGPTDAAALPADPALLADLSERLREIAEAAEDAAMRIDQYLRLLPAPRV